VSATPAVWARAYRPLRPRSLAAQLVVLVLVEIALYSSYADHDARFHWATHFLVALGFTALLLLARLVLTGVPGPRYLLLALLGFHLYAMAPDLLFRGGVPHYRWMDVFLGHVAAHYLPGGDLAWLLIALACTAGYVTALTLWLRARQAEAQAGLPPGVGVTGAAVLRQQLDPRSHQLAHEHHGDGRDPIVLLPGLGASAAFWRPVARQLAAAGCVSLVPDLLGFGSSLRLGTHFHLDDQAAAVIRLLEAHGQDRAAAHDASGADHHEECGAGPGPVLLVGHSYGAAVAVAVANARPDLVRRVVLVEPAAFADAERARGRIGSRSWIAGKTMSGSPIASVVCGAMCLLRRPLVALAPRVASRISPDVPADVARDAVRYLWPAYRDALIGLLDDPALRDWLADPPLPTTVVLGEQDETVPPDSLSGLLGARVTSVLLDGTHALPLEAPAELAALIIAAHGNDAGSRTLGRVLPPCTQEGREPMTPTRLTASLAAGAAALGAGALIATATPATADLGTAARATAPADAGATGQDHMGQDHMGQSMANPGMQRMHELMIQDPSTPRN